MKLICNLEGRADGHLCQYLEYLGMPYRVHREGVTDPWRTRYLTNRYAIEMYLRDGTLAVERVSWFLCAKLDQDCIAWFDPATQTGWLAGPNKAPWAPFDRSKFWIPDGWNC